MKDRRFLPRLINEPELSLIYAVYVRARLDLFSDCDRHRIEAELFLISQGFDPAEIRRAWETEEAASRGEKLGLLEKGEWGEW